MIFLLIILIFLIPAFIPTRRWHIRASVVALFIHAFLIIWFAWETQQEDYNHSPMDGFAGFVILFFPLATLLTGAAIGFLIDTIRARKGDLNPESA